VGAGPVSPPDGDVQPFDAGEFRALEERAITHAGTFLLRLGATGV
jgi:hypothetical protein